MDILEMPYGYWGADACNQFEKKIEVRLQGSYYPIDLVWIRPGAIRT
jgi:hypothetical protein